MKRGIGIIVGTLVTVAFFAQPAEALPTFAKAYGVQCSVCHTTVPQLNAYGRSVQRTGYAALNYELLKAHTPLTFHEAPSFDTGSGSGHIEFGNTALHMAGYITKNLTIHAHQWFAQGGQAGGLDTLQLQYSNSRLFNGDVHFFAGKLSALPVPGPFSNSGDLAPFASAELTVGEHMYQSDMMRWGGSISYVRPKFYAQVGWFGSNADLSGATDYGNNTDKTVQWIAAYADANKPFEAGMYGTIGSFPLSEGGFDHYNTIAAYVQRDPGPNYIPGFFATFQLGNDGNPGQPTMTSMSGATVLRGLDARSTSMGVAAAAHSKALTLELYESLLRGSVIVGLRNEVTNDGLGTIANTSSLDLGITPMTRYQYLHLYLEAATRPGMGPAWRGMTWLAVPIGGW